MRAVLKLAAYRRLLAAYALNELAWMVGSLALSYLVYRRTGSAEGATAFFLCAQFVPALLAPLLVARIDRFAPRAVLPALYAYESVTFLILGLIVAHFLLPVVLALALLDGIAALTARPLARATTVSVTSPLGLLREGNAVANSCFSVAFMVGPALGGAVVAAGGASAALFINAGLFAVIALTLATAAHLPANQPHPPPAKHRFRAALAYTRRNRPVRALFAIQGVALVLFTLSIPIEVVYAQHSLHAGASGYGALLSAWGAGAVAGSALYAHWRGAPARALMTLSGVAIAAGLGAMALAPDLAVALVGAGVAGIGNGVEVVAARTALQEQTHERWMAIVMSFAESQGQALPGIGFVIGGAIAALSGPRVTLAVGAVGSLFVALASWAALRPHRAVMRPAADPRL